MSLSRRLLAVLIIPVVPFALVACNGDPIDPPPDDEVGHVFRYVAASGVPAIDSMSVRGEFNDWGATPMTEQSDGSWRAVIELDDGSYAYKFFINGEWPSDMCNDPTWGHPSAGGWIDPDADGCVPDGHGGQNAVVFIGEDPGLMLSHDPANPAHLSAAHGRLSVRFRARQGHVTAAAVTAGADTFAMHLQLSTGLEEVWRAAVPDATGAYGITVQTPDGAQHFGPYAAPGDVFTALAWVGDAVGYQIFPERFWNGDASNDSMALATDSWHYKDVGGTMPYLTPWDGDIGHSHCCHQYYGGDLQGIIDRLDHLEEMGVTFIYMNPIFTSGSAHGYDASSFMEVAPNFGDEELLRALLDAAGTRGMRVMWDFVPNHVGVGFWAFQDAVEKGTTSPYWSWFNFNVPHSQIQVGNGNHYDAWWGLGSLPRLETRNDSVLAHLLEVTRYWTEFGLHGIRVDVPEDIRNPDQFFPAFRQAAREVDPEVYLVGEVWHRDARWVQGDRFDALMNYAIGEGVIERFAGAQINAGAAAHDMALLYADYPEASTAMQFNLISSHDRSRLLTLLGGGNMGATPSATALARQRLASAFLYALPGVPVTYQGDECAYLGATAGGADEHRYPIQWGSCDVAMFEHYSRLATLRADVAALRSPVIRAHHADGPVLSFFRGEPGPGEALVAFNNGQSEASLALPAGEWTDAVAGGAVTGSATIGPVGWRYLVRN